MSTIRRVSVPQLKDLRLQGMKASFVTAYDYPTAGFADRAGIDLVLVGDSAAMTMLGLPDTLRIGMGEMLVFARAVARAAKRALVIGDMPFLSYQASDAAAVRNAGAFLRAGCQAVKVEGGARVARRVRAIVNAGIPVMGHLGLTPQSTNQLDGYRVQGKSREEADRILDDARRLQREGIFALLLEAMPAAAAGYVRDRLEIPVYGIGAGPELDGQLLISHDLLGTFVGDIAPRFARRYAEVGQAITEAFAAYVADVRAGRFPAAEHCYPIEAAVEEELRRGRERQGSLKRFMARILVIDDNEGLRQVLVRVLEHAGYEVITAATGAEGRRFVHTERADLVILDVLLPDRDGLLLLAELRALHPELATLVITGGDRGEDPDLLGAARELGASQSLRKPFDADTLLAAVRTALAATGEHDASSAEAEEGK